VWDNDIYGASGNRTCLLSGHEQQLPVDVWNKLDNFDKEALLYDVSSENLYLMLFCIYQAKKDGKTAEDLAKSYYELWKGGYAARLTTPQYIMALVQVNQACYAHGEFIMLKNELGHVKFKFKKVWKAYLGKEGSLKNVNSKDFSKFYKAYSQLIIAETGMTLVWEESDDEITMTVKSK